MIFKLHIRSVRFGLILVTLMVLAVMSSACGATPELEGNQPPVISSLQAKYVNVYPRAASEIRCDVSDTECDDLEFKWSCTGGNLSGNGAVVTWGAPNSYGAYHIMVVVEDDKGGSTQGTLTVNVVARPRRGCCGR